MVAGTGKRQKFVAENQGKHFCQCGCGKQIPVAPHHLKRGIPRFANHHASKIINSGRGKFG